MDGEETDRFPSLPVRRREAGATAGRGRLSGVHCLQHLREPRSQGAGQPTPITDAFGGSPCSAGRGTGY